MYRDRFLTEGADDGLHLEHVHGLKVGRGGVGEQIGGCHAVAEAEEELQSGAQLPPLLIGRRRPAERDRIGGRKGRKVIPHGSRDVPPATGTPRERHPDLQATGEESARARDGVDDGLVEVGEAGDLGEFRPIGGRETRDGAFEDGGDGAGSPVCARRLCNRAQLLPGPLRPRDGEDGCGGPASGRLVDRLRLARAGVQAETLPAQLQRLSWLEGQVGGAQVQVLGTAEPLRTGRQLAGEHDGVLARGDAGSEMLDELGGLTGSVVGVVDDEGALLGGQSAHGSVHGSLRVVAGAGHGSGGLAESGVRNGGTQPGSEEGGTYSF